MTLPAIEMDAPTELDRSAVDQACPLGLGADTSERPITYDQFAEALGCFFRPNNSVPSGEYIFTWSGTRTALEVNVYSSISKSTRIARPRGTDCIRILVYDIRSHAKIHTWSSLVRRVGPNVLARVREKAGAALLRASSRPACPEGHGDTLVITKGRFDQQWYCRADGCQAKLPVGP